MATPVIGAGAYRYRVQEGWGKLPPGFQWGQVGGVAVDSQDRVYVFNRSAHPMMVFDRQGNLLAHWGEGRFKVAHGIHIGKDDSLFLVDRTAHAAMKLTLDGKLLFTIGTPDSPSDTGYTDASRTVKRAAGPFHDPTDASLAANGDLLVSDGYANARVHRFSPTGKLLASWGEPGTGPGQFNLVHSVWAARDGRVYVADRQNRRIQVFTDEGKHLDSWSGFAQPCKIFVDRDNVMYVAELASRVTICTLDGKVLARMGGTRSDVPGEFNAPHGIWVDSHGDMYVAEVLEGARLQKFIRVR
ncbi:MAG: hypothetical protein EXR67_01985 [Dehalococcoidia bacterium]|nr:hypothetical protein [Dehalococcoidia bacterium]